MFRKSKKLNEKGQAQLKSTIFFVTSFFLILGSVVLRHLLLIYSLFLITILYFAYHSVTNGKNGKPTAMASLSNSISKRKHRKNVKNKMKETRERVVGPRPVRVFLPLFIFIIILYIFLSNTLFFAVVTSDSMDPTFKTGDILLMKGVDVDVAPDDIIMFTVEKQKDIIIHRVDKIMEEEVYTKGDATNKTDNWVVEEENITAEVLEIGGNPIVLKNLGWYFITNPPSNAPFSGEMRFTSLMLLTLKNVGVLVFIICLLLYLLLTARDVRHYKRIKRA